MEFFIFWAVFGILSMWLASSKNRSGCAWLVFGILLGPLALLTIAFLPVVESQQIKEARRSGYSREYQKCPLCTEVIRREAIKCKHCGADLAAVDPEIQERLRKAQLIASLPPGRETEYRKHYSNLSGVQFEKLWEHIEELEPTEAEIARQEWRRQTGLDPLG